MINNVPPSPYVNTTTGLPPANNVAPTTGVPPTNYPTDGFSPSSSYASLASTPNSYPLSQIMFEQPSLSSRMGTFFMGSSDSFLKVGTTWIGRQFINLLSGNIPILTSKSAATQISNNINLWLGRSDLVRVGANPFEASLLQEVGVKNVNDLAILTNPVIKQLFPLW